MSKTGEIPYSWELIEEQIREAIFCQASMLTCFGPWIDGKDAVTALYLGFDNDGEDRHDMTEERMAQLDISRHQITSVVRRAYIYAYQLEGAEGFDSLDATCWHDADILLQGWPQTDGRGEPSPFDTLNDFPLRRMLETFFARWSLEQEGLDVSVRELSLLANMTVQAVRNSLSKEGFKLTKRPANDRRNVEEASFALDANDALVWLSRRRGFVPKRSKGEGQIAASPEERAAILVDQTRALPGRLAVLLAAMPANESIEHEEDSNWLSALLSGQVVDPELARIARLAARLEVASADLAAEISRHLMSLLLAQ